MIEAVFQYLNERLETAFANIEIKGLLEKLTVDRDGESVSFPAGYESLGEYIERADFDSFKGLIYFRKNGNLRTRRIEDDDWPDDIQEERTYPFKLIAWFPNYYKTDDEFIVDKLYENIRQAISLRNNKALLQSTKLEILEIIPGEFNHDPRSVWNEEYENIDFAMPFDKAYFSIDFEVQATGALSCFEAWGCGDETEELLFCPVVRNSAGTILVGGSGGSGSITIADTIITNSEDTVLATVPAGTNRELSDITFTDYNGVQSARPAAINIQATQLQRVYFLPPSKGAPSIYRTGDDKWVRENIFGNLPAVGWSVPAKPDDRLLLNGNNHFGNTNRFTNAAGTQTYADAYRLDNLSSLGWWITPVDSLLWEGYVDHGLAKSAGGYDDYFLADIAMLEQIVDTNNTPSSPFGFSTGTVIVSSTTVPNNLAKYYAMSINPTGYIVSEGFKNATSGPAVFAIFCRRHIYS